jgi:hypothetical protein
MRYLVVVVVPMTVAPVPVLLLLSGRKLAKVSMFIPVVLVGPLTVVNHLLVVPDVVIAIIRVIDPVVCATRAQYGTRQRGGQEKGTEKIRLAMHLEIFLPCRGFL